MKQPQHFNVIDDEKYKTIDVIPVYDSSGYKISINGQIRYADTTFTKAEIDEKLNYLRRNLKMERQDNAVIVSRTDEDTFLEAGARDAAEMKEVMNKVLPPIQKSKRKKEVFDETLKNTTFVGDRFTSEFPLISNIITKKRGRGRPPGSKNKPK